MNRQPFQSIFSKDFLKSFYCSNSFIYDKIFENDQLVFERVIFSSEYITKEYRCFLSFEKYKVERIVSAKWEYLKQIDRGNISIDKFTDFFRSHFDKVCEIQHFDPAKHNDWPGYHFHRKPYGAKIIIANISGKVPIPMTAYDFDKNSQVPPDKNIIGIKTYFSEELKIDFEKMLYLKGTCIFVFLYDDASLLDWKVFQDDQNQRKEGLDVRMYIQPYLNPFPKLELECELLDKTGNQLLSETKFVRSRYDISHRFLSAIDGEIHSCKLKLFEDGILIDDLSGNPIRQITVSMHIAGGAK